ncbi:ABC transporter substrate-binding protein [Roseomonas marmotae]|uniref:ABC transporter substrate-binding protein n=1 Tax=Roseomonas marmotae TaxID=2768161 RepID=A0ABS3KCF3_9PROT|nr:ABC transporter substrate-binding protein [Roseomonas marmotae]MBO1074600.1 ABC transporter substrate-binding protein [Roseomonas marmotae]QTI81627.1 ABC transporter substrate-binding protein [Roseomonas marmotae]
MFAPTRRAILAGTAAAVMAPSLARPALAQSGDRTLRFVPSADLSALDPIWTTGYVVRNHGYMVYDTLYAMDSQFRIQPQMAEGHEVTDDGRTWTIRLREGLKFHDGEPVRARDCVASIRRWAARDGFGATLMAQTEELSALDDRRLRFRLKAPFPLLAEALGKLSSPVPFIMPERLASTSPQEQIREAVGSGPFRFLKDEWVAGSMAAYARFDGYVPRGEAADGAAGGKHVHVDRVEWRVIPDASTSVSALQTGQVDWLEVVMPDLLPILRRARDVTITERDPIGIYVLLRFNHLYPPFDDVKVRQAVLHAVNQPDFLQSMVGDPKLFSECKAFFPCGTPLSTGAGGEAMEANLDAARAMLKASSYDGRKVVIISPSDNPALAPLGDMAADLLQRLGMNVELVVTDWGTVLARRASQKAPEEGGWNIFHTTAVAAEFMSPASHLALRGNGKAGWAGWYTSEKLEELRTAWFSAPDAAAQKAMAAEMEREAFRSVPYVPLGTTLSQQAFRSNVRDILPGTAPVFWNLRKA